MPRTKILQSNFSAGELAPSLVMRQDTEQYQNGARSLLNRRCLIGGGTKRRPGTWYLADLPTVPRNESFVVNQDTAYVLAFTPERVDCYVIDVDTGMLTAAGSVSSAPWTQAIYQDMDYEQSGDTAFLTHPDMVPQILTRTGASSWTTEDFTFYSDGPRTEQPYYKVADPERTLQPSALTGSITLTISGSGAHFTSDHIGTIVRYLSRECLITAVAGNGLSCTATVTERLPATNRLTVGSSAGFTVNEVVEGATTGAKGIVTLISDSTHLDIVSTNQIAFAGTENVVGPQAVTAMSATAGATAAAIVDWDEALFSDANGYPSCCALHRNRLLFAGHPVAPNALIASRLGNLYSFDVGDASDADGFLETIGDAGASKIVQLHSAEQLLVLTDHGPYYVPESVASPFRPSSVAFFPFGSTWPVTATARAQSFDDGVVFVAESVIVKARPTGNQAQQWDAEEVSILSNHLISNPTRLAVTTNFDAGPERYAVFVNDDGTLAVMQLVQGQKIRNFTPWSTNGTYSSICAFGRFLYVTTQRSVAGNTKYLLELFDQDITLDLATEYATVAEMDSVVSGVPNRYGITEVNVVVGTQQHLGIYPRTDPPPGPYIVGLYYDTELEILPPALDDPEGPAAGDLMRIIECYAYVIASQRFAANGHTLSAYQVTDDIGEPPPNKEGPQRFQFLGWEQEPTVLFDQPDPLPLDIMAVRTTVAF